VRPSDRIPLTEREVRILQLVARGHTNREIGAQLQVGGATIRDRLTRIYWKLGMVQNRAFQLDSLEGARP